MADENEGELQTPAEIAAARREFLSEPPAILEPETEPVVEIDDEAALLAEGVTPPAAPESPAAPAAPAAPAPAPTGTDPFAAYGGEEQVRLAAQVQEALRSEQGVRALVANGLTALGYSVEQVRAALDEAAAPAAPPAPAPSALDGLDDDDVVTVGSMKTLLESVAQQAADRATAAATAPLQSVQESLLAQQQLQVRQSTDAAILEVLGAVPTNDADIKAYRAQVEDILAVGAKYYDPAQSADPQHLRSVVQRAHADIEAQAEARYQALLTKKRTARDAAPVHTGGGAGGEGPLPEPKNLKEARAQARESGFFD